MTSALLRAWVALFLMAACAEGGPVTIATPMTVFVGHQPRLTSVVYEIICDGASPEEAYRVDGALSKLTTERWQGSADLVEGACVITLFGWRSDGQRVCVAQEPFDVPIRMRDDLALGLLCDPDPIVWNGFP